ncbi:MAG: AMP-binding protein, partial [Stellaceae bacterium]
MSHATLQELLLSFAVHGEAPAIIAYSGERAQVTSFAALAERAMALARTLVGRGIRAGDKVAITGPNGTNWIIAFWGAVATGAPVVALDAQLGAEEARQMLAAVECRLAFALASRSAIAPESIALDQELPQLSGADPPQAAKAEDTALLLFTSGTTGTPKGVPLTHRNLLSNVTELAAGIRQRIAARPKPVRSVFALFLKLGHGGARRILLRPLRRAVAPDLRLLVSGGAKLDAGDEAFLKALGWDVLTGYGLTETSPILAFNRPGAAKPGTAGLALSGVTLRIV